MPEILNEKKRFALDERLPKVFGCRMPPGAEN
jgi:hypothetical protein